MMGMGLFWILLIALVIVAVVWAVRSGSSGAGPPGEPRGETPEEALKRRYARGDITREEYERTLSDLRR